MRLVSWLRDLRRRGSRRRRSDRRERNRNDVRLALTRLEDRQVLSAGGLAVADVGDLLSSATNTSLGPAAGSFSQTESIGNGDLGAQDVDVYSLRATAGSRLVVTTAGQENTGTTLRLFDQVGNQLATESGSDLDGRSRLEFTFATQGTFFIGVSGAGNDTYIPTVGRGTLAGSTGDYELSALLVLDAGLTDGARTASLNGKVGDAGGGGEIDLYRFEAQAGATLTARTSLPAGSSDFTNTFLRLFDAGGNQLAFDDDRGPGLYSELEFTFTADGTYLVGVSAFPNLFYSANEGTGTFAGDPGDYRLTLSFGDIGDTLATAEETGIAGAGAGTFSVVETIGNGSAGDRDVDVFRFEAAADDRLTAETFAAAGSQQNVDTILRLFDAAGNELAFNDDRDFLAGDFFSRIEFTFTAAGTYFVGVSGFENTLYDPLDGTGSISGDVGAYRVEIGLAGAPATVTGTVFRDEDGDGERDALEPGQAGVVVFADANNNGALDGAATVLSTDAPLAIPDGDFFSGTPVTSALTVFDVAGIVSEISVSLDLTHTFVGDLDVFLISPSGTRVQLLSGLELVDFGGEDFTGTTFTDAANTAIADGLAPFTGRFRPSESLAVLDGEDPNGTWQLEITDNFAVDTGTLDRWSLAVSTEQGELHTLTDADGTYTLTELAAGTYAIVQIPPEGHVQSFPAGGVAQTVTVGPGQVVQNVDFGNQSVIGEIRGTTFEDIDGSGTRDADEPGIPGVTVYLDTNDNRLLDNRFEFESTDVPAGIFDFQTTISNLSVAGLSGLIADLNVTLDLAHTFVGDLEVFLVSPAGTQVQLVSGPDLLDFAGDNFAGATLDDEAPLSITHAFAPYTGSFRPFGSLAVLDGEDPNGLWELRILDAFGDDEGTLNNWSLTVSTTDGEPFALTDRDGNYAFTGLEPGTYVVRELPQISFVQTFPGGDGAHAVVLAAGQVATGVDFGNQFGVGEIRGTVFADSNGDGFQEVNEPGLEGATVFLDLNRNGILDPLPTVISAADVPLGIFDNQTTVSELAVIDLSGAITDIDVTLDITHSFNADLDVFLVSPNGTRIALAAGFDLFGANLANTTFDDEATAPVAFGFAPYSGRFQPGEMLSDLDGQDPNGVWRLEITDTFDFDEGTLNGWSLSITTDDPARFEPNARTDPQGNFVLTDVEPGTHAVAQLPPARFQQVFPAGFAPYIVTVAATQMVEDIDFGNQPTGTIAGVKFEDRDGDGIQGAGEPGLSGFLIRAFDDSGRLLAQTFTQADGSYALEVLPGRVSIVEVQQPGFIQTAPASVPLSVAKFDLESGAQGFTASGQWHLSTGRGLDGGHSPQTSFYFGAGESPAGGGQYASDAFGALLSPLISLPAGQSAQLEFNHLLDLEDFFDFVNVNVVVGSTRTEVASDDDFGTVTFDPVEFSDRRSTNGFERFSVDISQFAGQQIQVEFEFFSDSSISFEGWYIDDVTVTASIPGYRVTVAPGQPATGIDFGNFDLDEFGEEIAAATALPLVTNGTFTLQSAIDRPGDVDVFELIAPQDGFLAVRMTAPDFVLDSFLQLFDAGGNLLQEADDNGGLLDSLLALDVTAGERFFVAAAGSPFASFDGETGPYELSVTSTGAAQPLPLNRVATGQFTGTLPGEIRDAGQVRVFEINLPGGLPAGSVLTLDLQSAAGSDLDPFLLLFDAVTGELLQFNDDLVSFVDTDSRIQQRVAGGETFFAAATGFGDTAGPFRLTATVSPSADDFPDDPATPFNLGQVFAGLPLVQRGSIETAFDVDAFLVRAPAGPTGVLTINLASSGSGFFDPVLEVRSPQTGALIAFNDDVDLFAGNFNSRVTVSATDGQLFVVLARGFSDSRGEYTLTASFQEVDDDFGNTISGAEPLGAVGVDFDVDEPVRLPVAPDRTGTINLPGDVDYFEVAIPIAGTLQIRQNAVGAGTLDPFLRVFNAANDLLATNDDVGFEQVGGSFRFSLDSLVSVEVSAGDVIFVEAGAFGSSTGAYDLVFALHDDFPNDLPSASVLALSAAGATRNGAIEAAGDSDVFRVTATADGRMTFQLNGEADNPDAAFNPLLTVFQEFDRGRFREVARNGDLTGQTSRIHLFVQQGDEFVIRVSEFGTDTGTYQLSVTPVPATVDLGNTLADAELILDPALPDLGLDPSLFEIGPDDVDIVRFVARNTGFATVNVEPVSGDLNPRLAVFEFIADPRAADNQIPQQIASGGQSVSFSVMVGQQYAVRISGDGSGGGRYDPQINFSANVVDGVFTALGEAGAFVVTDVRQTLLSLSSQFGSRDELASRLIRTAVNTFTSSTSFDPGTSFLVLVLDPVDAVLSEDSTGNQIGFQGGQGQINEITGGFFSGDGVVEVLILPTADRSFNLTLAGLGAEFLFDARLVTPGGPSGGLPASVTLASTGQVFDRSGFSNALLGGLDLVLDFTATGGGGNSGPAPADFGLTFALSGESAPAASAFGSALGSSTLAFSGDAAQAIAQLRALALQSSGRSETDPLDRLFAEARQFNEGVLRVLRTVGDWVENSVGVPDAVDDVWSALVDEDGEEWWQKRQLMWSSIGERFAPTPVKLFFRLREAVQRFLPAIQTRVEQAPADAALDAGAAAMRPVDHAVHPAVPPTMTAARAAGREPEPIEAPTARRAEAAVPAG